MTKIKAKRNYTIRIAIISNTLLKTIFTSTKEAREFAKKRALKDVSIVRILGLKDEIPKCPKCNKKVWSKPANFCPSCGTALRGLKDE
jgi:hypothetical protein